MQIKVMTFNTQHCLNYRTRIIDFDIMASAIKACDPDIVVLNEMRGKGSDPDYEAQTENLGARLGYNAFFGYAIILPKGLYGNAILSRFPVLSAERVQVPDPEERRYPGGRYETRAFIKARVLLPDGSELTVLGTHFGLCGDERESSVEVFKKLFTPKRCVLMGDFNVSPSDPVLAPIRERMCDAGELIKDGAAFSFPSDEPKEKIDYIFATRDMKIVSAEIPDIIASDHRPHTAILEL